MLGSNFQMPGNVQVVIVLKRNDMDEPGGHFAKWKKPDKDKFASYHLYVEPKKEISNS